MDLSRVSADSVRCGSSSFPTNVDGRRRGIGLVFSLADVSFVLVALVAQVRQSLSLSLSVVMRDVGPELVEQQLSECIVLGQFNTSSCFQLGFTPLTDNALKYLDALLEISRIHNPPKQ